MALEKMSYCGELTRTYGNVNARCHSQDCPIGLKLRRHEKMLEVTASLIAGGGNPRPDQTCYDIVEEILSIAKTEDLKE